MRIKGRSKLGSESGMILMATTMGVFILLSIFAFYLARFSVTESRTGGYHMLDIKARNLALTGMDHWIHSYGSNRNMSQVSGSLNNGNYAVSTDTSHDEGGGDLPYANYLTIKSKATIDDVERNIRLIMSSMPEAFCFSYYGQNQGGQVFAENLGTISGDIYHNGNINTDVVSSGIKYNSTGSGGVQLTSPPSFPGLVSTAYEDLLTASASASGPYVNRAINFNNSSARVNIGNSNDINYGTHGQRTIEVWFRVSDKTRNHKQTIYEEGGGTRGINIYIHNNGVLYGGGWNVPNGESGWSGSWITWGGVQDNTWHHVAVTLHGDGQMDTNDGADAFKMYVDGDLKGQRAGSQLWQHSGNIKVGRNGGTKFHDGNNGGGGEPFYGRIDEFRIWNVERTVAQINDTKDKTLDPNDANGLVLYYDFQENSGTTATDLKGPTYNHGSITYGTWTSGPDLADMLGSSYASTTINLPGYDDNRLLVNSDLSLSNVTVNGPGSIVVDGDLTINSNSLIKKNVNLICNGDLTIASSTIGRSIRKPAIMYSKGTISINASTINGLIIAKDAGSSCTLSSTTVKGAILNHGSSFSLGNGSSVVGSVVSTHSVDLTDNNSSITKGSLPPFHGLNIGLRPMVVPGSFLEF